MILSSSSSSSSLRDLQDVSLPKFSDVLLTLSESMNQAVGQEPYPKLTALLQFLELRERIDFSQDCLGSLAEQQGFTADDLESVSYIDSLLIVTKDLSFNGFVNNPVDMDPNEEFKFQLKKYKRPMPFRWSNGVVPFKGHTFYMGLVHNWLDCWVVFEPRTPRDCDHDQHESAISVRSAQLFYELILNSLSEVPKEVLTGNNVTYCRRPNHESPCDDETEQWEGLHATNSAFVSSFHAADVSFRISALGAFANKLQRLYSSSNYFFFKEHVPKLYLLKFGQNLPIAQEQESILNYLTCSVDLAQIERTTIAIAHNVKLGTGLKKKFTSLLERQTATVESSDGEDFGDSSGLKNTTSLLERQTASSDLDSGDSNGLQEYTSLQERQMAITMPESGVLEYFGEKRASLKLFRKAFSPSFCNFQSKGDMPSAVKDAEANFNDLTSRATPFCKIWGVQGYTTEANTIRPTENSFPFANDIVSSLLKGDRKTGGMQDLEDQLTLLRHRVGPFGEQDVHYRVEFYSDFDIRSLSISPKLALDSLNETLGDLSRNLVFNHGQIHDTNVFPCCIFNLVASLYAAIQTPLRDAHERQSLGTAQAEIVAAVEQLIKTCITGNPRFLAYDFFELSGIRSNVAELGFPWVDKNVFDPNSSTLNGDFLNALAQYRPLVGQVDWRHTNKQQRLSELASVKFKMAVESHKKFAATSAANFFRLYVKDVFMNDMSLFLLAITEKKNQSSLVFNTDEFKLLKDSKGLSTFQMVYEMIQNNPTRLGNETITLGQLFDTFFRPVITQGVASPALVRSWMSWHKTLTWLAQKLRLTLTFDPSWAFTYFKEALAETLPLFLNSKGTLLTKFGQFAKVIDEEVGNHIFTGDYREVLRGAGIKAVDISMVTSQRKDLKAALKASLQLAPGNTSWQTLFYLSKGDLDIPKELKGLVKKLGLVFDNQVQILGHDAAKLESNWLKFVHFAVVLFACFQHKFTSRQKKLEIMDKLKVVPKYAATLFIAAMEKLKLVEIEHQDVWKKLKENNSINDGIVNRLLKPKNATSLYEARYFDINLVCSV